MLSAQDPFRTTVHEVSVHSTTIETGAKPMVNKQHVSPRVLKILAALAVFPAFVATTSVVPKPDKALAQSTATQPTFPLPSSLPSGTVVKVDGSSSLSVINEELKKRFEKQFPGSSVTLATNGTSAAIQELQKGTIDLAAAGRSLSDGEKAQGLKEANINREKIAIIVGPDNPFKGSLTSEQFAKIFRGEITNWSQVGGPSVPIKFIDRPESSDTRQALSNYSVFKVAPFKTGANATQVANDDTAEVVAALGSDGISYAIASQVLNQPTVRVIALHETLPDNPKYPYSQPRGYIYKDGATAGTLAFLGFATSKPGQEAVAEARKQESTTVQQAPASPEPTATATASATAPATEAPAAAASSGFDWSKLWWLLIPLIGIPLLFWLFKDRGEGAAAGDRVKRIILTPRNCRDAYAYWEVDESYKAELRKQGGRDLKVRLFDVTGATDINQRTATGFQEFDAREDAQDLHIPIAADNHDYVAELGYKTADGAWLPLTRSERVRVPACAPGDLPPASYTSGAAARPAVPGAAVVAGGVAATAAAAAAARSVLGQSGGAQVEEDENRIILVPRNSESAYAYWEVTEAQKTELRRQGGRDLKLRIYDATGINLDRQPAHNVREYAVTEADVDRHVPILASDRDYVAELGYTTEDGRWLSLARSLATRVPAPGSDEPGKTSLSPLQVAAAGAAATLAGAAGVVGSTTQKTGNLVEGATGSVTQQAGDLAGRASGLVGDVTGKASGLFETVTQKASGLFEQVADKTSDVVGGVTQNLSGAQSAVLGSTVKPDPLARITLVPRDAKTAYVSWEVPGNAKTRLRELGGTTLILRIYDATNLDIEYEVPHATQEYFVNELDQGKHVPIQVSDRDYVAELGYRTDDGRWLPLARSLHAHVPSEG